MTSEQLLKQGGLFKVRLELTGAYDKDDYTQAEAITLMTQDNGSSHYIVCRELYSSESLDIQATEGEDMDKATAMQKLLPSVIVEHSFKKNDKGDIAPNGDVYNILKMSTTLLFWVLEEWQKACPLGKKTKKESDEQPDS